MIFKEAKIKGLYIVELELFSDERGFFTRNFCKEEFAKAGMDFNILQANLSLTKKMGTIRGLHFQKEPKQEAKIVQCLKGTIYDVAVDLRGDSQTYGQWVAEELSGENKKMFLIPKGFAHGFQAITDDCLLQYFISEFYHQEYESGVRWDDPFLNIKWPIENPILSEKDKNLSLIQK